MDDLISRSAALAAVETVPHTADQVSIYDIKADALEKTGIPFTTHGGATFIALGSVRTAPTIEAEPVRHGRWVSDESDVLFHCSECETQISTSWDYDCDEMWNYCPHCGAKMYGEQK